MDPGDVTVDSCSIADAGGHGRASASSVDLRSRIPRLAGW